MKKWIYTGGVDLNDRFLTNFVLQTPVFLGLKLDLQVVKLFCETSVKNIFNDSNTISPKSVKNMKISSIFQDFHEFHRFSKMLNHRFSVGKLRNLTFSNDFPKFHEKNEKMNLHWWRRSKWSILDEFRASNTCFLRVKVGSVGGETFLQKISEKISSTTAIRFLRNPSKNMKIFKILIFLERFGSFTKIRKEKDF